jgi:hypothetical protein
LSYSEFSGAELLSKGDRSAFFIFISMFFYLRVLRALRGKKSDLTTKHTKDIGAAFGRNQIAKVRISGERFFILHFAFFTLHFAIKTSKENKKLADSIVKGERGNIFVRSGRGVFSKTKNTLTRACPKF